MPHFIGVISQNLQAELASDFACGLPGYSREVAVFVCVFWLCLLFVPGMLGHTGVWPHFLAAQSKIVATPVLCMTQADCQAFDNAG